MPLYQLNVGGNPTNPMDYTATPTPTCPTGTNKICSITAADDGSGRPVFTTALRNAMIESLHNRTPNLPTVNLKA
nr:hypothetical protein [uncultured Sphingobacterium sp.]